MMMRRMKVCICIGRLDDKEEREEIFFSVIFNLTSSSSSSSSSLLSFHIISLYKSSELCWLHGVSHLSISLLSLSLLPG